MFKHQYKTCAKSTIPISSNFKHPSACSKKHIKQMQHQQLRVRNHFGTICSLPGSLNEAFEQGLSPAMPQCHPLLQPTSTPKDGRRAVRAMPVAPTRDSEQRPRRVIRGSAGAGIANSEHSRSHSGSAAITSIPSTPEPTRRRGLGVSSAAGALAGAKAAPVTPMVHHSAAPSSAASADPWVSAAPPSAPGPLAHTWASTWDVLEAQRRQVPSTFRSARRSPNRPVKRRRVDVPQISDSETQSSLPSELRVIDIFLPPHPSETQSVGP